MAEIREKRGCQILETNRQAAGLDHGGDEGRVFGCIGATPCFVCLPLAVSKGSLAGRKLVFRRSSSAMVMVISSSVGSL